MGKKLYYGDIVAYVCGDKIRIGKVIGTALPRIKGKITHDQYYRLLPLVSNTIIVRSTNRLLKVDDIQSMVVEIRKKNEKPPESSSFNQ